MRKIALVFLMMAMAITVASGVALAATITGTARDEVLVGTDYADDIRADDGDDEIYGLRGPDWLDGGRGRDVLRGGRGDDFIESIDLRDEEGNGYRDVVDCGPGLDTVSADLNDRISSNCEDVALPIPGPA